ncbi:MAG: hypothetical protein ABIN96_11330 [Rubrivivax sp.]
MDDDLSGGFAPPPFKPDAALLQLQRALRDLKLSPRGDGFEMRSKRFAELRVDGDAVAAGIVRKPALTPEWDRMRITSPTEQRKWLDEVKRRLTRWERDD